MYNDGLEIKINQLYIRKYFVQNHSTRENFVYLNTLKIKIWLIPLHKGFLFEREKDLLLIVSVLPD